MDGDFKVQETGVTEIQLLLPDTEALSCTKAL